MNTHLNSNNKPGKTKAFFICLLFAFAFWLIHDLSKTKNMALEIKLEYKNMPPFLLPMNELPAKLNLNVSGTGLKLLLTSFYARKKIQIDFNQMVNLKNANQIILSQFFNQNSPLPLKLKVITVLPDTLYFIVPKGSQKNVVVKSNLQINCKAGYGMELKEVNPKFITIYGSQHLLKSIDTVYSESMQLFEIDKSDTYQLKLIKLNDSLVYSADQLVVATEVQRLIERTIILPVKLKEACLFRSAHVYPNTVTVKYTMMQNEQIQSDTTNFKAEVFIGRGSKHPVLITTKPGGANILSILPKEVELVLLK